MGLYTYVQNTPANGVDALGLLTVNIWEFRGKDQAWGHASVTLEDGTHISWWPSSSRSYLFPGGVLPIYSAPPNNPQTYADDVMLEGQEPDLKIVIKCLDEDAIKTWWLTYKSSGALWKTLRNNCSTVTYRALRKGGGQWAFHLVWKPNNAKAYAESLREKEKNGCCPKKNPNPSLDDPIDWPDPDDPEHPAPSPIIVIPFGGK